MIDLFIAVLLASQEPDRTLPLSEVAQAEPLVLAPRVLPAETSERIAGGWVRRWWVPGQVYRALFWEQSRPHGDGVCARRVHVVELGNRTAPGHPDDPATILTLNDLGDGVQYGPSYPEPASEARCAELTGYIAAPADQIDAQLAVLGRLTEAMRLAAGTEALPFSLECDPQGAPNACDAPRAALAELPLDRLLRVGPSLERIRAQPRPAGPRILMEPVVNAPLYEAQVDFDTSGRDGRSWMVTLEGRDRMEVVRLRRATIIRH